MLIALNIEKLLRADLMRLKNKVTRLTDKAAKSQCKAEKLGERNEELSARRTEGLSDGLTCCKLQVGYCPS